MIGKNDTLVPCSTRLSNRNMYFTTWSRITRIFFLSNPFYIKESGKLRKLWLLTGLRNVLVFAG